MKKFILFTLIAFATSAFAQEHPTVTYDGGDLYFVPAKLTSKGIAFMYNTPRFSDRHNYGGMTRNRYICKKEENQNGKTI